MLQGTQSSGFSKINQSSEEGFKGDFSFVGFKKEKKGSDI